MVSFADLGLSEPILRSLASISAFMSFTLSLSLALISSGDKELSVSSSRACLCAISRFFFFCSSNPFWWTWYSWPCSL